MRRNVAKEKASKGEVVIGVSLDFPSPELVEFCCLLGFEWVFIDAEHGPIGWPECQAMTRACDVHGVSTMVRVPRLDYVWIVKYLETGVLGVAVPHINTVEDAEQAVRAARYSPVGIRGSDPGASRASDYGLRQSSPAYFAQSNQEIIVAAWIEEEIAFRNLDAILQVPGIDAICFGPGDLALSMGLPGQMGHPEVQAIVQEGRQKVVRAGKILIGEVGDLQAAKQAVDYGARIISTTIKPMLTTGVRGYLSELRGK